MPSSPFNLAKSIYAGRSVVQLKVLAQLSGVTGATNVLTSLAPHGLNAGQSVIYVSGTSFTGLTANTQYYVVSVPSTTTFEIAATVNGTPITVGSGTSGVFQPTSVFESMKIEHKDGRKYAELKRPDTNGIQRVVRKVCVEGAEQFTFVVDEVKRAVNELFSGSLTGIASGTATIWEPDPTDATGNVALKSAVDFSCTIQREGNFSAGDGKISTIQVTLSSLQSGDITWTTDGLQ
jgi:hypothetical protein